MPGLCLWKDFSIDDILKGSTVTYSFRKSVVL